MQITCPYCFEKFEDTEVHFRSERMNTGECPDIPADYDDYEDFMINFRGPSDRKTEIMRKYAEWSFFKEGVDEKYDEFWKRYGGVTTESITRQKASYRSKILDPKRAEHQNYLKKQSDGEYIKFVDGFATSITLSTGEICMQRVCPQCHNPLPNQYGKNEARFIAVIGITGAGKTVYLSQLIYGFEDYVAKAGLASLQTTDSPLIFRKNFLVSTKKELPNPTPADRFLQPLFYDLSKTDTNGKRKVYTLVIYDIAGENCSIRQMRSWFGPFIEHMHGVFLLIDPMQFKVIKQMVGEEEEEEIEFEDPEGAEKKEKKENGSPTTVLQAIHFSLSHGSSEKCDIPLAICISKSDKEIVQNVLDADLVDKLMDDVEPVTDGSGRIVAAFNSKDYNPIAVKLHDFIKENELALETFITNNYSCYNYFAFSALGCEVKDKIPEGPIMPKRIEEPLLWLFHKFGFIGVNQAVVEYGNPCPKCKSTLYRHKLIGEDRIVVTKRSFFGKPKEWLEYNYKCEQCQEYYN